MSEIRTIMDYLGRGIQDGEVRGSHLGQILMYFRQIKKENMKVTLSKLALICGTSQRNLRENYIEGLGNFGIINIRTEGHSIVWDWIGKKAFDGKPVMSEIREPLPKEEKEEKPKKGYCPSCGKKLKKDKKFCNEECLREYYNKRKKEGKPINYEDIWINVKGLKEKKVNGNS